MDTILTKQTQHKNFVALIASAFIFSTTIFADEYSDARADLIAAYQQENYAEMLLAANKALEARPEFPNALFNLSLTQTLNGDHASALQTLEVLLEKGVDFGADELDDFSAVRQLQDWADYASKLAVLNEPIGAAHVLAKYDDPRFVPEGIAVDDEGSILLGSIHRGQLIEIGRKSEILSDRDQHWSVFGMRLHPDGSVWFASAAVPQLLDVADDEGKTGLFRYDLGSRSITRTAELPQSETAQVLGDLVIADANTIYATDSLTGAIYRYCIESNEFEILVDRGELGSPQGLVLDNSGAYLYVADYIGGLFRVSLLDGSLVKVQVEGNITDYGIDGLYRYGDELIAIQNGVRPHRVVALTLSGDGRKIIKRRTLASNLDSFDEPTLGTIVGDDFYFVANSHWNRFDQNNQLPDGLSGPIVLNIKLN